MSDEWIMPLAVQILATTSRSDAPTTHHNVADLIRTAHAPFREKVEALVEACSKRWHDYTCDSVKEPSCGCTCSYGAIEDALRHVKEAL